MVETARDLRQKFNRRFLRLYQRNTLSEGALVLFFDFGTIALSITVSHFLEIYGQTVWWLAYFIAVVVIGTRLRSFGNIVHECSHSGFVNDRIWNERIGRFLSVLLCYSYRSYKAGHKTHHQYTGDYDRDLDFADTKTYAFHKPISLEQIKQHLKRLLTFQFSLSIRGEHFSRSKIAQSGWLFDCVMLLSSFMLLLVIHLICRWQPV